MKTNTQKKHVYILFFFIVFVNLKNQKKIQLNKKKVTNDDECK